MGLYDQPNSWQCGPFALKHGLLGYGIFAHEDVLAEAAGSTPELGTDERQLANTARDYGCRLLVERYRTASFAQRALRRYLAVHTPVLLCLDQWDHWVTAVGADDTHVVVLDSHYDTVVRLEPWSVVFHRLGFRRRPWRWGPTLHWYDLHPLLTRGEPALRLALNTDRARRLLEAPATFRRALDEYAQRLVPYAAHNGRRSGAFALAPWLTSGESARGGVTLPAETLERVAFAAELFDVRCDAAGARDLARSLATKPAEVVPMRAKAIAAAEPLAVAS
jgi:hypothetical protein